MKRLRQRLLAAKIEYYWWRIQQEKKQGKRLLEAGRKHSSEELIALNNRFSKHCASVMRVQRQYEEMTKAG